MKESIINAFSHRTLPESLIGTQPRDTTDRSVLESLQKLNDWMIPISFLEQEYDFFTLIDGAAFCYFLPRTMLTSFNENRPDLLVVDSLISDLDRSPRKDYWDKYFIDRWPRLTKPEVAVVSDLISWLSHTKDWAHNELSLIRAMETLDLLAAYKASDDETPTSTG
jgi:hypothetical protein